MDAHDPGDPGGPQLTLVTVHQAADGSAAALLRPGPTRNEQAALTRLENVSIQSQAVETRDARERFQALPPATRQRFIERIVVLDLAPDIDDIGPQVEIELRFVIPRQHSDVFVGLVWQWWYQRVIDMLQRRAPYVTASQVMSFLEDLRDRFTHQHLPTTVMETEFDPSAIASYTNRTFVKQLGWVKPPTEILETAILDYYMAYTQTARWLEQDLVDLSELETFEERLRSEWKREFAWAVQDLPEGASEAARQDVGRRLLRTMLGVTSIRVRQLYDEPFFSRGKQHELAEEGRIGWHPDFKQKLEELLIEVTK
jgi:hypothetical protein